MRCYWLLLISMLAALAQAAPGEASPGEASPGEEQQQALRHLLKHDCGSCHGMTLKGGLGPALTPAALQGKSAELLIDSIIAGRPGTAMPPWQGLLSREEAAWIVEQLLQGNHP